VLPVPRPPQTLLQSGFHDAKRQVAGVAALHWDMPLAAQHAEVRYGI
jgi:hypothetical protein